MNQWEMLLDQKIDMPVELYDTFKTKPIKKYRNNQIIYRQGEMANSFYYLKDGMVQIFVNSQEGLEKNITIYKQNEVFGEASFFDGFPRISSAKTITDSEIITIDRLDILQYFESKPFLALKFIELLSKKVRMLSNEIDNISFLSAEKRIIQYLLKMNVDSNGSIDCTQEDIGKAVGVSRVTVSRTLSKLSKLNWIVIKYKKIYIINPNGLFEFFEK